MLYNHFTEKRIGLQHIEVEKIEKNENSIHVFCKLKRVPHKCPCCGNTTDKIHDYREQVIKDIPPFGKHLFMALSYFLLTSTACVNLLYCFAINI